MSTIAASSSRKRRASVSSVIGAYEPGGPERQFVISGSGYRRHIRRGRKIRKVSLRRIAPTLIGHCSNDLLLCNEIDKYNGKVVIGNTLHTAQGGTGASAQVNNLPLHIWELNQMPGYTDRVTAHRLVYQGAGNSTLSREYKWEPSIYAYTSSDGGDGTVEVAGSLSYDVGALSVSPAWRSGTETAAELRARRFNLYRGSTVDLILYGQKQFAVHYRVDLVRFKDEAIVPYVYSSSASPAEDHVKMNLLGESLITKYVRNPLLDVDNPGRYLDILKTWTYDLPEGTNENSNTNGIDHLPSLRTTIKIPMNKKYTAFKSATNAYGGQSYAYRSNPEDASKLAGALLLPEQAGALQYKYSPGGITGDLYPRERLFLMIRASDPKLHVATDYVVSAGITPSYDIKIRNKWAGFTTGVTAL